MEPEMQPTVVKAFFGDTQEIAAERYAADAVVATRLGYEPTSQTWDGAKLTVVYERHAPSDASPPQPAPEARADTNAKANQERAEANARANQERAEANAWANQQRASANTPAVPPPPRGGRVE